MYKYYKLMNIRVFDTENALRIMQANIVSTYRIGFALLVR